MSNKKLNENKQLLNEDWSYFVGQVLPVLTLGLFAAVKIGFNLLSDSNFKASKLSRTVYDSLDKLYDDREFVKDFVAILEKEGNLEDMVKSAIEFNKQDYYKYAPKGSTKRNAIEDGRFYRTYILSRLYSNDEWDWDAPASRVISNVMKSNGYKKFSKKHNFTSQDDTMMRALFYYMISRPDFAENVKKYLYTAVKQNKNTIIRAIDKTDFDSFGGL
jgi:hypothetical protein